MSVIYTIATNTNQRQGRNCESPERNWTDNAHGCGDFVLKHGVFVQDGIRVAAEGNLPLCPRRVNL